MFNHNRKKIFKKIAQMSGSSLFPSNNLVSEFRKHWEIGTPLLGNNKLRDIAIKYNMGLLPDNVQLSNYYNRPLGGLIPTPADYIALGYSPQQAYTMFLKDKQKWEKITAEQKARLVPAYYNAMLYKIQSLPPDLQKEYKEYIDLTLKNKDYNNFFNLTKIL